MTMTHLSEAYSPVTLGSLCASNVVAGRLDPVRVQFLGRGRLMQCGVAAGFWQTPEGKLLAKIGLEPGEAFVPLERVRFCSHTDGRCVCEQPEVVPVPQVIAVQLAVDLQKAVEGKRPGVRRSVKFGVRRESFEAWAADAVAAGRQFTVIAPAGVVSGLPL